MTTARQFIAELQSERRSGKVSSETEQHRKYEFRNLVQGATYAALSAAVGPEIDRLECEAATLRKLRAGLFGASGLDARARTPPNDDLFG
jgi:hypothetical protein